MIGRCNIVMVIVIKTILRSERQNLKMFGDERVDVSYCVYFSFLLAVCLSPLNMFFHTDDFF